MEAYSPKEVYEAFGSARLKSLLAANGDVESALLAYRWELNLGQALLKPIGITEVVIRNAIDAELCAWWTRMDLTGTWIDAATSKEAGVLAPFVHASSWRKRAESNLLGAHRPITHDDLIAHSSFGTWRNMIGNPASLNSQSPAETEALASWRAARTRDTKCADLWKAVLHGAFPGIPKTKKLRGGMSPRGYIGARLTRISSLRNRVCHWDNLTRVNVEARFEDMKELVTSANESVLPWLLRQCEEEILQVVSNRPEWLQHDRTIS